MLKPDFTFKHLVTVRRWKERGISADVYEAPEQYACRVDISHRRVQSGGGAPTEHQQSAGTVFLTAGTRIPLNSIIEFSGITYTVSECRACYDGFSGAENHVEVTLV